MDNNRWIFYALLGAVFAAAVSVMTKRALDKMDFTIALTIQCIVMLGALLATTTLLGRWSKLTEAPTWAMALVAGAGVAAALSWLFGYKALELSKVASSTPINNLSLPIGVVLAMLLLSERPTAMNWFGIVLMTIGAFFVASR